MKISKYSDEAFAAYVAGLLDGEGSIECYTNSQSIRIRIANTNAATLRAVHRRAGFGRIEEYRGRIERGYKRLFCFTTSSAKESLRLLTICRPYMQIKANQADIAICRVATIERKNDLRRKRNTTIIAALMSGETQANVGRKYGLTQAAVSRIKVLHQQSRCDDLARQ